MASLTVVAALVALVGSLIVSIMGVSVARPLPPDPAWGDHGGSGGSAGSAGPSNNLQTVASSPPTGVAWSSDPLLASLEGRQGAAVASETGTDLALVFGGANGTGGAGPLNDTYVVWYDNQSIHRVPTPAALAARSGAALAWDGGAAPGRFVLFGGRSPGPTYDSDTWWFFPSNFSWEQWCPSGSCTSPSPRWGSILGAEPGSDLLALFGGQGYAGTELADTWSFTTAAGWSNVTSAPSPPPLVAPCATTLPGAGGLLMFGGLPWNGLPSAETWELTWSSLTWGAIAPSSAPPGREGCALSPAGALAAQGAVLYGGLNASTYYGDAWVFDPASPAWTSLGVQAPGARAFAGLLDWSARGTDALWMYGGADAVDNGLVTSFSGALLPAASPPTLGSPATVPAPLSEGVPFELAVPAASPGGLVITQVELNASFPGGGGVQEDALSLLNGSASDGNWSADLPAPASAGALTYALEAFDNGGGTVSASGQIPVLPTPGTLVGTVLGLNDSSGLPRTVPLVGAAVFANGTGPGNTTTALTNALGDFSFTLPAGTYAVNATAVGYVRQNGTARISWSVPTSLDLVLAPVVARTGTLQGSILGVEESGGRMVSVPVDSATVFANGTGAGNSTIATTDAAGAYSMALLPGTYQVSVTAPGYVNGSGAASIARASTTLFGLVLNPRVPPVGTLQGFVYGLTSVGGKPNATLLADAVVRALGTGPGNETNVTTDDDGAFSLGLLAGTYLVNASCPGYLYKLAHVTVLTGTTTSFDFQLPSASTNASADFLGNVTVAGSSLPEDLVGVRVAVNASDGVGYPANFTDRDGAYEFSLLPGASYQVVYTLGGYGNAYYNFSLAGSEVVHHDVALAADNPAEDLVIELIPSTNSPVTGAQMTVQVKVTNGNSDPISNGNVSISLNGTFKGISTIDIIASPSSPLSLGTGGVTGVTFPVPGGISSATPSTLKAEVVATGFAVVTAELRLTIIPPPPATSSSVPISTYAAWGALAFVIALFAIFIAVRRNPSRVEEIFLVYKGGKLVWHASRTARADLEPEVVSGMLEAIEGFVQRSFTPEGGHLNVLEFAEMKLHIVRGQQLTAAALLSGRNPKQTVREVAVALADMEKAWEAPLKAWDGTAGSLPHLRAYVEALLSGYYKRHTQLKVTEAPADPSPTPPG